MKLTVMLKSLLWLFASLLFSSNPLLSQNPLSIIPVADVTVHCGTIVAIKKPTVKTSCNKGFEIKYIYKEQTAGTCPTITTRSWTVSDLCGNTATVTQKITFIDVSAPGILEMPSNVTVNCNEIPAPAKVVGKDKCDPNVTITVKETKFAVECANRYKIRRDYIAKDRCGNVASRAQIITVRDLRSPSFLSAPLYASLACHEVSMPKSPQVSDNCSPLDKITLKFSDEVLAKNCPDNYIIKRTWLATDECGNTASQVHFFYVMDTQKPEFSGNLPQNITVNCDEAMPEVSTLKATDNCDKDVTISFLSLRKEGSCPNNYQINREWIAKDNCRNTRTIKQTITVVDNKAPVFPVASDLTLNCNSVVPLIALIPTDNCDKQVAVTMVESTQLESCNFSIIKIWSAKDACGNTSTTSQKITFIDNQAPVFQPIEPLINIGCGGEAPAVPAIVVNDDCDKTPKIIFDERIIIDSASLCGKMIHRQWTATDKCQNTATIKQILSFNDNVPPTILGVPPTLTIECGQAVDLVKPAAKDDCSDALTYNYQDVFLEKDSISPCKKTMLRTWTITDVCGNMASVSHKIIFDDFTAPTASFYPENVIVTCNDTIPSTPIIKFYDNCTQKPMVIYAIEQKDTIWKDSIIWEYDLVRTWTAADSCSNIKTVIQNIKITNADFVPPIIDTNGLPDNVTIECSQASVYEQYFPPASQPTAIDACGGEVKISYVDEETGSLCGSFGLLLLRKWVATDASGNSSTFEQSIQVIDKTAPTLFGVPKNVTLSCGEILPDISETEVVAVDKCGVDGEDTDLIVTSKEVSYPGNCANGVGSIKRFWTVTDGCGNTSTKTQTITFVPNNGGSKIISENNFIDTHTLENQVNTSEKEDFINIYPNPSQGQFTVSTLFKPTKIVVYNVVGEVVEEILQPQRQINTINLEKNITGIYLVKVEYNNDFLVRKVLIKH